MIQRKRSKCKIIKKPNARKLLFIDNDDTEPLHKLVEQQFVFQFEKEYPTKLLKRLLKLLLLLNVLQATELLHPSE